MLILKDGIKNKINELYPNNRKWGVLAKEDTLGQKCTMKNSFYFHCGVTLMEGSM